MGVALAAIAGGALDWAGGQSAAKKQMRFQERMAGTQYQRAAKDLEAAGLNRILALGSPAPSPGGAQAPPPQFANSAKAASDISKQSAEKRVLKEQENATIASAKQAEAQAEKLKAETLLIPQQLEQQREQLRIMRAQAAKEEATTPIYKGAGGVSEMLMNPKFIEFLGTKVNSGAKQAGDYLKKNSPLEYGKHLWKKFSNAVTPPKGKTINQSRSRRRGR